MGDRRESAAIDTEPRESRPRAPTITIVPEPQPIDTGRSTFFAETSAANFSEAHNGRHRSFSLTVEGIDAPGGLHHLTIPSNGNSHVGGNLLDVPSVGRHFRSQSTSSLGSRDSGWTTSPGQMTPASEVGDSEIDVRALLDLDHEDNVTTSPFAFTTRQLAKLFEPKDLNVLRAMGGLEGLCLGLRTDVNLGLSWDEEFVDGHITLEEVRQRVEIQRHQIGTNLQNYQSPDHFGFSGESPPGSPTLIRSSMPSSITFRHAERHFAARKKAFGENRIRMRDTKSLLRLMWEVLQDKVLILLCSAAIVSLILGIYEAVRPGSKSKLEWIEGVAILIAVAISTVAQAVNDYQKERQFRKLNYKKNDREVKVIRGGRPGLANVHDVVVGDILLIEPGDIVPVDAVLAEGHNIGCDEASITGESETVKKAPARFALDNTSPGSPFLDYDPFILSGSKALEGTGKAVITGVGENSCYGRTMMAFQDESEDTPLQVKLNHIADMIAKWGGSVALLLFAILFIKFLARLPNSNASAGENGAHFMRIFIVAVSIVVVAVPEGLPLAVTLALAYATVRMLKDNNLVRVLKSCETMGNATTICCDKTGTLTENKMVVVSGTLGLTGKFARKYQPYRDDPDPDDGTDDALPMQSYFNGLSDEIKTLLRQSIAINSTTFEDKDENGQKAFVGSKTETALLMLAKNYLGMDDVETERRNANIVHQIAFSSERKWMGTVVKLGPNGDALHRFFVKGAWEIVLQRCTRVIDLTDGGQLSTKTLSEDERHSIERTATAYGSATFRVIALVYCDFRIWPPKRTKYFGNDISQLEPDDILKDLVFVSLMVIQDPLRDGVKEAVQDCRKAGVFVRMVTGDNVATAKSIAKECGILSHGGIVMEGPRFRNLTEEQMDVVIPRLQVLARSSPQDKRILVERLKALGETVAVTGDGTNDGPALKTADVGFSMGIAGTEVAKEASSIILMDDNFASIVKAIAWGRCVNDAVKKFLQLTVSVTAVGLTFVTSIYDVEENPVISPVQLLWVNLIQDTLAALALATDPLSLSVLNRMPEPKDARMISFNMWKMIFGQSCLQLVVTLSLNFVWPSLFPDWSQATANTVIFNTFVWLQFFNEINCRRIDDRLNVFYGIHRNPLFISIMLIIIICQAFMIFFGDAAFSVVRLSGPQWLLSIVLGVLTIPFGALVRLIPNKFIAYLIPRLRPKIRKRSVFLDAQNPPAEWNEAIETIHGDLQLIKALRSRQRLASVGKKPRGNVDASSLASSQIHSPGVSSPRIRAEVPSDANGRRLYSVFNADTVVPALVATVITLPPVSPSENALDIGGVEIYGSTRPEATGENNLITFADGPRDAGPAGPAGHLRNRNISSVAYSSQLSPVRGPSPDTSTHSLTSDDAV